MSTELETVARYRQHAQKLRTVAASMSLSSDRATVLQMALDFERMAASLEAIDRADKPRGREGD
jgi:hypothetical protein